MEKTMLDKKGVIRLVETAIEKQLGNHPGFPSKISVYKKSVRKADEDWWQVGVFPSDNLTTVYYYYDIIAKIEEDLQDDQNLKIALIPVRPKN